MDKEPHEESDKQSSGAALAEELLAMKDKANTADTDASQVETESPESPREETAWREYKGYDEAYEKANAERGATGKIAVERYPQATLIAQVRLDEATGEVISGHDYNPEAQSHTDTEAEFSSYIDSTPPEERFVVYEGGDGSFTDRDRAIRDRADGGLTMFLSDKAGVERTSGDPTSQEELEDLIRRGVSTEEAALFTTLRGIGSSLVKEPVRTIDHGGNIYSQLARSGLPGFREYSEEEKIKINEHPEVRDALLAQMAADGTQFAMEKFNPVLQELGLPQFEVGADGALTLPGASGTQLVEATGPSGDSRLNEVAKMNIEFRDRHLFDTIADATKQGKKPFVVYGGSHVVALKPALDSYFGQVIQVN